MGLIRSLKVAFHEIRKRSAREETPPRYIIRWLGDFSDIPPHRWDAFLVDFEAFVGIHRGLKDRAKHQGKIAYVREYVWADDGSHEGTISVRGKI